MKIKDFMASNEDEDNIVKGGMAGVDVVIDLLTNRIRKMQNKLHRSCFYIICSFREIHAF